MVKFLNTKVYFFLCIGIVCYFLSMYLLILFEISFTPLNVFGELITIPLLIGQIVLLFWGIKIYSSKKDHLILAGIIMVSLSTILTIGSFLKFI
ncbi:hypothetical protein ALE3EI_1567 [Constantimarinum furrinae]|uniref:Uncharacterized protein n=1 Tax=Constantimarinum furrinae TaxID=2562285 RepID=A0A7G8PUV9_9FLAO|nr:hypothetical protein ALE3EI_1567 [Constantimarinum furrinae]